MTASEGCIAAGRIAHFGRLDAALPIEDDVAKVAGLVAAFASTRAEIWGLLASAVFGTLR